MTCPLCDKDNGGYHFRGVCFGCLARLVYDAVEQKERTRPRMDVNDLHTSDTSEKR